jgi:hypothetical protein
MTELETIVKLLSTIGGDAKWAFIAYLIAKYGVDVLIALGFVSVIFYGLSILSRYIKDTILIKDICEALGMSSSFYKHEVPDRIKARLSEIQKLQVETALLKTEVDRLRNKYENPSKQRFDQNRGGTGGASGY